MDKATKQLVREKIDELTGLKYGDDETDAIAALVRIGPQSIPMIFDRVESKGNNDRLDKAIRMMGKDAIVALMEGIARTDDSKLILWACPLLSFIGFGKNLKDAPLELRNEVRKKLTAILSADLHNRGGLMTVVVKLLGRLGAVTPETVRVVARCVFYWSDTVTTNATSEYAFTFLRELGAAAKPAVPVLREFSLRHESGIHFGCARALWIVEQAQDVIDALIAVLTRPLANCREDSKPRRWKAMAAEELALIGPLAVKAVPALAALVKSKVVCRNAVTALGAIGPGAASAAPEIIQVLGDPDKRDRFAAAVALCKMGKPVRAVIPVLTEALPLALRNFEQAEACLVPVDLLGRLGPAAKEAVPALKTLAKATENQRNTFREKVHDHVVVALQKIAPGTPA